MPSPVTVTFRHLKRVDAVEARARELGQRLQRADARIKKCHFTVAGGPDNSGNCATYTVKIHLSVPAAEIHADSLQNNEARHVDVYLALHDAFDSAKRQLLNLA